MTSRRAALTSAGLVGLVACLTTLGLTGAAQASSAPPWEPDAQSVGTITFYNTSGAAITSGSVNDAPMAAYAVGSKVIRSGDTRAELVAAQPNPSGSTATWNVDTLSSVTTDPVTTGPGNINSASASQPVVAGSSTDLSLADFITEFPNTGPSGAGCAYETGGSASSCTNSKYENIYQLRIVTLDSNGDRTQQYDDADVLVSGTTWTEVYPTSGATTAALKVVTKPKLSGSGRVGSTEKVSHGTWSASPTSHRYQWFLGSSKIKGATKSSYKLIAKDKGKKISCLVSAAKSGYDTGFARSNSIRVKAKKK